MNRIITLLVILTCLTSRCFAQQENWDVYVADYGGKPGSTLVNMDIKAWAPRADLPFILITGVKFENCDGEGFPQKGEFENLYKVSDTVLKYISELTDNIIAGAFTHQCERLDYIYIKDSTGVRAKLTELYKSRFQNYAPYINIKEDKQWNAYLNFLYPNEETREYMSNQKVVLSLVNAGDKLSQPRKTDHWAYFENENDRKCFQQIVTGMGFSIGNTDYDKDTKKSYKLQFSRTDKVDLENINRITSDLRKKALTCNGEYDGWETFVIKE